MATGWRPCYLKRNVFLRVGSFGGDSPQAGASQFLPCWHRCRDGASFIKMEFLLSELNHRREVEAVSILSIIAAA